MFPKVGITSGCSPRKIMYIICLKSYVKITKKNFKISSNLQNIHPLPNILAQCKQRCQPFFVHKEVGHGLCVINFWILLPHMCGDINKLCSSFVELVFFYFIFAHNI